MKFPGVILKALIAIMVCLGAGKASAAYDAFLNVNGISGEATAQGHSNEIAVLNFSLNVTNGSGTAPLFSPLKVTKPLDKASPFLVLDCAQGTTISKVTLTLRDQTTAQVEFYKVTLLNAVITSVQTGGNSSDGRPMETVTFSFQKIQWEYQPVDTNGNPVGTHIQTMFNLVGGGA